MDRLDFSPQMLHRVADLLSEDNLENANKVSKQVVPSRNFYAVYIKRLIDIIVSFLVLVVTSPINLIIAVITFFDVGRPIIFKQKRTGKDGKNFTIIKFRNMRTTTDENGELLPAPQRVTKWGKIVRKTSLDELLNFWSILKGDMSIIGPRPLLPQYMDRYTERHKGRLLVRPGLECPPHERLDHVWTWEEQFENDIWYVENLSFKTDCLMLIRLVQFAFDRKNATSRAGSKRRGFMGYSADGVALGLQEVPEDYIKQVNEIIGEKVSEHT